MKGHHIEDCHHLKREIETLIQKGRLLSYVKEIEGQWETGSRLGESQIQKILLPKRKEHGGSTRDLVGSTHA